MQRMSDKGADFGHTIDKAENLLCGRIGSRHVGEERIRSTMAELKFLHIFVECTRHKWSDASSSSSSSSHNTNTESLFIKIAAATKELESYLQYAILDRFMPLKFTTKLANLGRSARHPFRSEASEFLRVFTSLNAKIALLKPMITEACQNCSLSSQSFQPLPLLSTTSSSAWESFCQFVDSNLRYLSEDINLELGYRLSKQMEALQRNVNSLKWFFWSDDYYQRSAWKDKMKTYLREMIFQVAHLSCLCWYNPPLDQSTLQDMAITLSDLHRKMNCASPEFVEIALGFLGHWQGRDSEESISSFLQHILNIRENGDILDRELVSLLTCLIKIRKTYDMDVHSILEVGVKDVLMEAIQGYNYSDFWMEERFCTAILFARIWSLKAEIFIKSNYTLLSVSTESIREGYRFLAKYPASGEGEILKLVEGLPEQVQSLYQSSGAAECYLVQIKISNLLFKSCVHIMLLKAKSLVLVLLKKDASQLLPLKHKIGTLYEGLFFLIDVVISQAKEDTDNEKLILRDIEVVAAGVISLCNRFPSHNLTGGGVKDMDVCLIDLLEKVQHLMPKLEGLYLPILRFSFPKTPILCFIELLLQNLRDVLYCKHDLLVHATLHIEAICKDLEFIVYRFPRFFEQGIEKQECKDLHTQLADVVYQVEHVIDLMLDENKAVWQHSLWLYHLWDEIRHVKMQLTNFHVNNKYDDGVHNVPQRLMPVVSRITTTTNEEVMVGFNDQKEQIVDRLTRVTLQRDIISIVGMPGIGKTTLAYNVFCSQSVMYRFPIRAWCCVSQTYKNRDLLLEILSHIITITDHTHAMSDADLAELLYKQLKGKRYLIIMDDMWSTKAWDDLQLSFPNDSKGSRILLTSRLQDVMSKISDPIPLCPLSKEESWKLLKLKTFWKEECPKELLEVGQQIAKNCKGLPLAICAIAGLLDKTNKNQDLWKKIAESVSSRIVKDPEMLCKEILELSYNHLPDHLKACFLYFGAFPEDKDIPVQRLQWLWIAEGFVCKLESKSLENLAEDYLMDLVGRSLVMVAKRRSNGKVKACRVHDVVRDLCLLKAKDDRFLKLISANDEPYSSFNGLDYGVRYEHFNPSNYITYEEYRLCFCVNREQFIASRPSGPFVRSLQFFATTDMYPRYPYDVSFIPNNYKRLRVLDLESINMGYSLANGTESLVDLRYLAVCGDMESIPSSLSNLQNLETFIVKALRSKVVLPDSIWSMKKLRHVHVTRHAIFTFQNDGSGSYSQLDSLVTLSSPSFTCGEKINNIRMRFPQLRELRCIFLEPRDVSPKICQFPALESLQKLESLKISYYGRSFCTGELNLPSSLKKLTLSNFRLPWNHISAIGRLQNLEVLKLISRAFEGSSWNMTEGEFLKLKYLELDTINVVSWVASSDHLPQLQQLLLRNCKQLEEVPFEFVSISTLQKIEVQQCGISVDESVKRIDEVEIEGLKIVINNSLSA